MQRVVYFMLITLQTSSDIKETSHVRRRIKQRRVELEEEKFQISVFSTVMCGQAKIRYNIGSIKL